MLEENEKLSSELQRKQSEMALLSNELKMLKDELRHFKRIHKFLDGCQLGKIVLDLKLEQEMKGNNPTTVYITQQAMCEFLKANVFIAYTGNVQGVDMLYGLKVKYTTDNIRVE